MRKNKDIIYLFGSHSWEWVSRRPEHMAMEFSRKGHRVLFVETPFDFDVKNFNFKKFFTRANFEIAVERFGKGRLVKINQDLWVYKTPFIMPRKFALLKKLSIFFIRRKIRKIIKKLNFDNPALWLGDIKGMDYIGSFQESLVCWDSMDEETGFTDDVTERNVIRKEVEALSGKVDMIFATSGKIYEDKKTLNNNTYLVPNAVDYDFYSMAEGKAAPDSLKFIKKPVLGYIGHLEKWLDTGLLKYMADYNKSWQIVLVGPSRVDVSELEKFKNIHLIEKKDYREMPFYINCFDVCLIPFKADRLTDAVNPLKAYEYLALGKPVVSTDFFEMRYFKDLVYIGRSKEEFAFLVDRVLNNAAPDAVRERKEFAKKNTWRHRADEVLSILDQFIEK